MVDGSLWENMLPFWKSSNNQYITPDPNSNPIMYYIKWVVSEMVAGFNAGIMNDAYTDGYNCPYEIPDQWQYEYQRQWSVDIYLKKVLSKFFPKVCRPHPEIHLHQDQGPVGGGAEEYVNFPSCTYLNHFYVIVHHIFPYFVSLIN